ncbi:hypothetical protein B0H17DRAFT_878603, partial [Mycena rosella]
WCDADNAALIRKLRECKDMGMQSESGWKPQVWHLCAECLKGGAGGTKTADKISAFHRRMVHAHFSKLKSAFITVRKLREQSGFGWDDGLKMVTASDDVWEVYIEVH